MSEVCSLNTSAEPIGIFSSSLRLGDSLRGKKLVMALRHFSYSGEIATIGVIRAKGKPALLVICSTELLIFAIGALPGHGAIVVSTCCPTAALQIDTTPS